MKSTTTKIFLRVMLALVSGLLLACEQPTANVSSLGKPLPTAATPDPTPTPSPTPTPKIDPRRTDLNRVVVGTKAPDFSLRNIDNQMVRLSDYRGKQNIVLVFYRGYF